MKEKKIKIIASPEISLTLLFIHKHVGQVDFGNNSFTQPCSNFESIFCGYSEVNCNV